MKVELYRHHMNSRSLAATFWIDENRGNLRWLAASGGRTMPSRLFQRGRHRPQEFLNLLPNLIKPSPQAPTWEAVAVDFEPQRMSGLATIKGDELAGYVASVELYLAASKEAASRSL